MSLKHQAATLLARGCSPAEVATQLAVTPSYISQIQTDDEFCKIYDRLVAGQQVLTHSTMTKIDNNYNTLELAMSELLVENQDVVLASFVQKPGTLLAAMRTINGLKRRAVGEGTTGATSNTSVQLNLPSFMIQTSTPQVRHNLNNEVIEVDGEMLVSASGTALKSQLGKLASTNRIAADALAGLPDRVADEEAEFDPSQM